MPWFEPLSSLDAMFLRLEDEAAHMHVGAVTVYAGKPPRHAELEALIASRLDRVPRYRQRLEPVPFGLGRPVWVDDPRFDLDYHVRHTALPAPGDDAALRRLVGRLFAQRLDRAKPLWEAWLVDGLAGDRFAIVWKIHHCMIDGIAGVDIAAVLHDARPDADPPAAALPWTPRPAPDAATLATAAVRERIAAPLEVARVALREGRPLAAVATGALPLLDVSALGPAPACSLNQPIGPHRRWETAVLPLSALKRVRAGLGGTVNDVLLAALAGALRRLLEARGEAVPRELRALVPVSVRAPEARGTYGNQVSAVFCPLPVGEPDPVERLRAVAAAMKRLKGSGQIGATAALTRLPAVAAVASSVGVGMRWFNIVATNVPGPREPLFLLGRRLQEYQPMVPLARNQTIGVAFTSYVDAIHVGLLGDADRARDLPLLARALPELVAELAREAAPPPDGDGSAAS